MTDSREERFLEDWVDDPSARRALRDNGVLLVDNFREAIAGDYAADHARGVVPTVFEPAVDETVAVRLYAAAAALMARLSCGYAAACAAEEMLGAYLVIQSSGDLQYSPQWQHLTDAERRRAGSALDGLFDLFQDDEALSLYGATTGDLTTPDEAAATVRSWFEPFADVHVTGHLDDDVRSPSPDAT